MIKNAVFDLGNVLVSFDPEGYMESLGITGEKRDALLEALIRSKEWSDYDRGVICDKYELASRVGALHPELRREIDLFLADWETLLTPQNDSVLFMKKLKKEGVRVFLLSNLSYDGKRFALHYDFMKEFEGTVFSCDVHRNKPEPEIFHILTGRYGLNPAETIFFDDHAPNVRGAEAVGIRAVLFTDAVSAEEAFRRIASEEMKKDF